MLCLLLLCSIHIDCLDNDDGDDDHDDDGDDYDDGDDTAVGDVKVDSLKTKISSTSAFFGTRSLIITGMMLYNYRSNHGLMIDQWIQ